MAQPTVIEGRREDILAALDRPEMEGRQLKLIVMPDEPAANTLLDEAISRMARRSREEVAQAQRRAMGTYPPARPLPPGKTLADVIAGQWPGDETDEQVQAALDELS
jgi:hypothetical protein